MYPNPTIAPGAVGTAKLADNAVTSAKFADGTIGTADIADGAVMAAKLSATGGSDGQVLKLSGGNLAWGTDETGGFELPYQGSINSDWPAFVITDNGQGVAVNAVGTGTLGIAVNGYHQTSGNFGRLGTAQYGVLGQAYGAGVRGQHATSGKFGYLGDANYGYLASSTEGVYGRGGIFQRHWGARCGEQRNQRFRCVWVQQERLRSGG
jgi:hypothetical protein